MYCKEKWYTADGNSSLFWHDDGFQPDPARAPAAADLFRASLVSEAS